jgi:prepilin-type N-terminal cleavage/methylation domain-containing protein
MRTRPRAFTLVELLVVIAIIGVLVSILLPALKNARRTAKLTQSLTNIKNITIAQETYRTDHKGWVPYMIPQGKVAATWSFAGKNCDAWWASNFSGFYDFPAITRPANQYIMHDIAFEPINATNRDAIQMPVLRSPGDIYTVQRTYPNPTPNYAVPCYSDVGTSYHYNGRWYSLLPSTSAAEWSRYSYRISRAFGKTLNTPEVNSSKFVLFHDQAADLVSNDGLMRNWITEFGDRNKCVMSFVDGHADYLPVVPGAHQGPGYIFQFPRLQNLLLVPTTGPI